VVGEELNYLRAYLTEFLATQLDEYLQTKINNTLRQVLKRIFPKVLQKILPQNQDSQAEPRTLILEFQDLLDRRKKFSEKMQTDPANAILALVEEAKDRLVRAKGIKDEWKSFLDPIREQLWADELSRFNKDDDALKCAQQIQVAFHN